MTTYFIEPFINSHSVTKLVTYMGVFCIISNGNLQRWLHQVQGFS